jgi:hypothetical protein
MSCTTSDGLDRSFITLIKEIERGYHMLSKQYRLRVEKWIEKLITSGGQNLVWKKHRNEYTKLLLHMVISKKFTEPFHQCPPDGQLPQFPKHISQYHLVQKASDAHELTFWKDIYVRLNASTSQYKPDDTIGDYETITSKDIPSNRELKYLKLCDTENKIRIELLEQQLRDEKLHYGLQVQRLEYAHRAEISTYTEAISSSSNFNNQSSMLENQHYFNGQINRMVENGFSNQSSMLDNQNNFTKSQINDEIVQNKKLRDQQILDQEISTKFNNQSSMLESQNDLSRSQIDNMVQNKKVRDQQILSQEMSLHRNICRSPDRNKKVDYSPERNRTSSDETKENFSYNSRPQHDRFSSNESKGSTRNTSPERNPGTYNDTQASPRKLSSVNFSFYDNQDRSQSPSHDIEYSRTYDRSSASSNNSSRDFSIFPPTKLLSPTKVPKISNSLSGIANFPDRNRPLPNSTFSNNYSEIVSYASPKLKKERKAQQTDDDFLIYIEEFQSELKKLQDSSLMKAVRSSD